VSHANAALTPRARLRLARLVVDRGWTCSAAAKMFMVAPRTARKWADRYRTEGQALISRVASTGRGILADALALALLVAGLAVSFLSRDPRGPPGLRAGNRSAAARSSTVICTVLSRPA
jgi:hypothetical protein